VALGGAILLPISGSGCMTDEGIGGPRVYTVTYRLTIDGTGEITQLSFNDGTGKLISPDNPVAPYSVTFPAAPGRQISASAGGTVTGTVELSVEAISTGIETVTKSDSFTSSQNDDVFTLIIPVEVLP